MAEPVLEAPQPAPRMEHDVRGAYFEPRMDEQLALHGDCAPQRLDQTPWGHAISAPIAGRPGVVHIPP